MKATTTKLKKYVAYRKMLVYTYNNETASDACQYFIVVYMFRQSAIRLALHTNGYVDFQKDASQQMHIDAETGRIALDYVDLDESIVILHAIHKLQMPGRAATHTYECSHAATHICECIYNAQYY